MSCKPRNTLVLLKLRPKADEQVGTIIVPSDGNEYTEAEVMGVGPGTIHAAGAISETGDLRIGQRVLVKHRRKIERPAPIGHATQVMFVNEGLRLRDKSDDGQDLFLFDQTNIFAILAEASTVPVPLPTGPRLVSAD